jgi:hypothetical protein
VSTAEPGVSPQTPNVRVQILLGWLKDGMTLDQMKQARILDPWKAYAGVAERIPVLPSRSRKGPTTTSCSGGAESRRKCTFRTQARRGAQPAWHSISAATPAPERVIPPGAGVHDFPLLVVETHYQYGCSPFS